jgi:TolA-binding protein
MKKSLIRMMTCAAMAAVAALAQSTEKTQASPKAPEDVAVPSVHVVVPDIAPILANVDTVIEDIEPDITIQATEAMINAADVVHSIQPVVNEQVRAEIEANVDQVKRMRDQFAFNIDTHFRTFVPGEWQEGWGGGSPEQSYRNGTRAIDRHDYDTAIAEMDKVIGAKAPRADGAYYWKAYAQAKLGRTSDAMKSLADLHRNYPKSAWLNDAKALEVEIRQRAGQPMSPDAESNEDLKLLAMNGLMNSDPAHATPLVEKVLNDPKNAPKLRERALFVLARSNAPEARQTVVRLAEGSANPDLQLKAIQYLGVADSKGNTAMFADLYRRSSDNAVKRTVLQVLFARKDRDALLSLAKTEQNVDLRRQAIQFLGAMGATDALGELYGTESSEDAKRSVIDSLAAQGSAKQLIAIAKRESNPKLKRDAVERLSTMNSKEANDYMLELLGK